MEDIKNEYSEGSLEYIELNNAIESILEIKMLKDSYIQSEIEERKKRQNGVMRIMKTKTISTARQVILVIVLSKLMLKLIRLIKKLK